MVGEGVFGGFGVMRVFGSVRDIGVMGKKSPVRNGAMKR